jgi:cytochrome c5
VNQQDKSFLITFTIVISVLVLISIAIFLAAQMVSLVSVEPDDGSRARVAAEERIAPVAVVALADPSAQQVVEVAQQSPEQIYTSVCAACHDAGVLEAPKTGSKEDWEPRFAQGLDTLVDHAVNGINAMPAKGGNPNLSDDDIRKAIVYMLEKSDIPVGESTATGETPTQMATAEGQPKPAEGDGPQATNAVVETAATSIVPSELDLQTGEQVYGTVCSVCHANGVAGAPTTGDKDAWAPRLSKGWDTLVEHSIKGFNAMPAKGGRVDLPDDQIISAVGYLISQAQ